MDIFFSITIIVLLISGFYFIYQYLKSAQDQNKDNEGNKLMLEIIEKLRGEVRGGLEKNSDSLQKRLDETLKMLDQQFNNVRKSVDHRISENTKSLNDRLDNSAKVIYGVKEELGRMREIGPQIKKLHELLGGQKLRGNLGEQIMNDLISQVIPPANYEFQYTFRGGDIVDSVIKTKNGLIPIDSKFPLENYRRILNAADDNERKVAVREFTKDVRKHIRDISKKYIRPEEGTMDFAFMYVPADAVFFEIIVNSPELNQYAQENRVFVVSPSMFYSSLQVILLSFQSQKFEEHAKQVLGMITGIKKESQKFGDNLAVLNKHVGNAKNKMDEVCSGYNVLDNKISQVSNGQITPAEQVALL